MGAKESWLGHGEFVIRSTLPGTQSEVVETSLHLFRKDDVMSITQPAHNTIHNIMYSVRLRIGQAQPIYIEYNSPISLQPREFSIWLVRIDVTN